MTDSRILSSLMSKTFFEGIWLTFAASLGGISEILDSLRPVGRR